MADSHLGFDLPTRPRVRRRRRGHDFLANHRRALRPALDGKVDIVVHGGDVFHRSRVAPSLVHQAFQPLKRVADTGIPVFVVPGNHERSKIPHRRLASHVGIRILDSPATHVVSVGGTRVAVSGFPFQRRDVRTRFRDLLAASRWDDAPADIRLLCMHHCVEGATVGSGDYTFRDGEDVIRGRDLPTGIAAVLSGHIHRYQILTKDLFGRPLASPVVYPGSIERTSIAEIDETKGYVILELHRNCRGGAMTNAEFVPLPARPMVQREARIDRALRAPGQLELWIREAIASVAPDTVLRLRIRGTLTPDLERVLASSRIRELAPPTMNVDVTLLNDFGVRVRPPPLVPEDEPVQTELRFSS